ncbi:hypothetical protein VOLCADRAFT_98870 [Volvox carteri f. nagariensis]|uniref:Peptidase M11 gametolysin domain-containing protein n=1 Tax=Volvox carteri f. nagariensis TaxID=3068 RepID=D8UGH9_VOLCA|nr:uncharacterized protein VOLCADRAFT_98870 [Volvox carteri f. nagariensis]EFJ41203.1 hypothetical protein VOLCADRAFT_98870 [Volvox carteri f. nagariensis]|eukprot:XP_002957771.1 hypothetical protein VOLCADRAFT_98870 [Volvox carteri f. nagariensis]
MTACVVASFLAPLLAALLLVTPQPGARSQSTQNNRPAGNITGIISCLELEDVPSCYINQQPGGNNVYRLVFCADVMSEEGEDEEQPQRQRRMLEAGQQHQHHQQHHQHQERPQQRQRQRALLGESITTPTSLRILVYIASFCGYDTPASVTTEQVTDLLLTGKWTWRKRSLAAYFSSCSYGQVSLLPENIRVLGPVTVPCNGTLREPQPFSSGGKFTTSQCTQDDNMKKWHYWLDAWAAETHDVDARDYHHRVLLLPSGFSARVAGCNGFSGTATAGRWSLDRTAVNNWGSGLVWWSGDNFADLEVIFHEIGHNYGMAHANVPGGCKVGWGDQCDHTCAMGSASVGQGIRCLNAPHNWQMSGALVSSVIVTGGGLPYGQRLFISARTNTYSYDLPWDFWNDNVPYLLMHTYSGTDAMPYSATVQVGEIGVGNTWRDVNSSLVVRFDSWDRTAGAAVRICRRVAATEANCYDGLDDDCDFLPDAMDPDCRGAVGADAGEATAGDSDIGGITSRLKPPPPPPRPRLRPPSPQPALQTSGAQAFAASVASPTAAPSIAPPEPQTAATTKTISKPARTSWPVA